MSIATHWLSRVVPRPDIGFKQIVQLGGLDPYGQHQALWKLFNVLKKDRGSQAEFFFRAETHQGLPLFFVLSRQKPIDADGLWEIEPKPYAPNIREGDRLAFRLRVNPVELAKKERSVTEVEAWRVSRMARGLKEKLPTKKRVRHDVVMATKLEMGWKDMPPSKRPSLASVAAEAGAKWLRSRQEMLGCVVDCETLRVDGYRTYRLDRRNDVRFSSLDFDGCLSVSDAEKFRSGLLFGVGPAKGFGCGLMLVRRI